MKKKMLWVFSLVVFLILAFAASAVIAAIPLSDQGRDHWNAPGNSPVITVDGDLVRVDFIHYARGDKPVKPSKKISGYDLLGVKWLVKEDYYVNLSNTTIQIVDAAGAIEAATFEWDSYTDCTNTTGDDLFGSVFYDNSVHYGIYDNINVIEFGNYSNPNVIAVTSIWYNKRFKSILEYDMLFNNYYDWSADENGNPDSMDLQNIATHEFGHAVGLGDIYDANYSYVTMYGYSFNGDIEKRTLADPDILGLQKIYGGFVD